MDPKVNQGPLINTNQFKRVCNLVDGARAAGANVVMGGSPKGNLHFQPTIITDVNPGMEVFKDEIFGPVISVIRFKHENVSGIPHTVRNLHFLSKNSTLISQENCRFFWGEKLVKMLWFWTF